MSKENWELSEPDLKQLYKMKMNILRKRKKVQKGILAVSCCLVGVGLFSLYQNSNNKETSLIINKEEIKFDLKKLPKKQGVLANQEKTTVNAKEFEGECLQYTDISLKGTVIKTVKKNNNLIVTMDINKIFYQKEKYTKNQIEIWIPLHTGTYFEDLLSIICEKSTYYANLTYKNDHYESIYLYLSFIKETLNGYVVFSEEWKSLIDNNAYHIAGNQESLFQLYAKKIEKFEKDYIELTRRCVSK